MRQHDPLVANVSPNRGGSNSPRSKFLKRWGYIAFKDLNEGGTLDIPNIGNFDLCVCVGGGGSDRLFNLSTSGVSQCVFNKIRPQGLRTCRGPRGLGTLGSVSPSTMWNRLEAFPLPLLCALLKSGIRTVDTQNNVLETLGSSTSRGFNGLARKIFYKRSLIKHRVTIMLKFSAFSEKLVKTP